jgi:catalase
LRLYGKYAPTLQGRKIGVLLAAGFDPKIEKAVVAAIKKEKATPAIIAPKVGGVEDAAGVKHPAQAALRGSPSVLFDAVVIIAGAAGDKALAENPDAVAFLMDACRHLKAIALSGVPMLAEKARVVGEVGVTAVDSSKDLPAFLEFARAGKVWDREQGVAPPPAGGPLKK